MEQSSAPTPIVVDLGTASRKAIRQLKRGQGTLLATADDVVADLREQLGPDADDKEFVPIVVVYSRKSRRQPSLFELILG
jgi:hypothetical protein